MASSIFHTLSLILFHLLLASSARTHPPPKQTGFRATLTRVHSGRALPKYTSTNTLGNDPSTSLITSQMEAYNDVYTMTLSIGTQPVPFTAIMDTGSNLIWTKCKSSGSGSFDTSKSTSFSNVNKSCDDVGLDQDCTQNYDDGNMSVRVTLGQETLSIGDNKIKNVIFGCGKSTGENSIKFDGVVGMGPGNLSLVSHLEKRVFSYCLGSRFDQNARSVLLIGSEVNLQNGKVHTTQLVMDESNYYISLEGISIGETKLPVTIASSNGSPGGMIIDSGSTFTYLEKSIIDMISEEFLKQTKLEKSNDTAYNGLEHCFMYQGYNTDPAPKLVFHFKDADWELPKENYLYKAKGKNVACLAFIANKKEDSSVSIFGNMMQQNMLVTYDLDGNSLSFMPGNCN